MAAFYQKGVFVSSRKYLLWFVVLLLTAGLVRFWGLDNFDASPDEHHFIQDAYRLYTGDPYTVARHHPFQHGQPFVGHPYFAQYWMILFFNALGSSVATGRTVMVVANLVALLGTYVLGSMLFSRKAGIIALALLVLLPHDIRYARDGHLDPMLGATLIWAVIALWKLLTTKTYHWAAWLGIVSAFVWATKINGPFLFVFFVLAVLFWKRQTSLLVWLRRHLSLFAMAAGFFVVTFVILVSPEAYLDALLHPADPEIAGLSKIAMPFFTAGPQMVGHLITTLYSWPFALLVIGGLVRILVRRSAQDLFLLSVVVAYGHIFVTHVGHSGEYGYITLNPYFGILAGLALLWMSHRARFPIAAIVILLFFPITVVHGMRLDVGKWTAFSKFNDSNFRYGQTLYRDAIAEINGLPGNPTVLWVRHGDRNVPFMEIRGGVRLWPFIELKDANTILVAQRQESEKYLTSGEFRIYKEFRFQQDVLWVLRRI